MADATSVSTSLATLTGGGWVPTGDPRYSSFGGAISPATGDTNTATANLALINAALAAGGDVLLNGSGVAYINGPIVLRSNARLRANPNLIIRQAPGINKSMLVTQALLDFQAGGTTVTITWSAGLDFTVNWTGHGKAPGQAIVLFGATGALAFNGVFRVHTVTDANSFVCKLRNLPSASPGGTIKAINAVQNASVEGLTLDYDTTNNNGATDWNRHAAYLYGVADLDLRNIRSGNATKYAYCIQAGLSVRATNLVVPWNNSDGLKLYGPLHDVNVVGLAGRAGDDGFSVQAKEAVIFANSPLDPAGGDATAVTVRDSSISTTNASVGAAKVYLSDNEYTDKIVFENLSGIAPGPLVTVELGNAYTTGLCGKLTFRDLNGSGTYSLRHASGTVDQIVLENFKANPLVTTGQIVIQDAAAICRQFVVNGSDVAALNWPSSAVNALQFTGTVDQLTIKDVVARTLGAGQNRFLTLNTGSTVRTINLINCKSDGDNFVIIGASVTNTPQINMHGCEFTGAAVMSLSSSADLFLSGGCRFNNASNGVLRFNATATVNLRSDGTSRLVAGSWVVVVTGTPTINVYGNDISVDVGATGFTKTNGQYCLNTSAGGARGTLVANRLVTANGTAWVQVDTPTNVF